jgi:hypothetical protein
MSNKIDLTGKRFGKLVVIKETDKRCSGRVTWLCKCDCGNEKIIDSSCLRRGDTQSCGCLYRRCKSSDDGKSACANALYSTYKSGAIRKGVSFELSFDAFYELTQKECYYCGRKPFQTLYNKRYPDRVYNGVDRIDSYRGYTTDNVVPCCRDCNFAKRTLTQKEFYGIIEMIYNNRIGGKSGK